MAAEIVEIYLTKTGDTPDELIATCTRVDDQIQFESMTDSGANVIKNLQSHGIESRGETITTDNPELFMKKLQEKFNSGYIFAKKK